MMDRIALVVGATGITGSNLAQELVAQGWKTYGLSRHPKIEKSDVFPVKADLLDSEDLMRALETVYPTHIFFTTWMRQDSETANIEVNSRMVRNLLDVLFKKYS
ncbi:Nucleoside-diphosphate-sugar epimerases [Sphingobacterium faecium PCAi_F2.5]|nr:Nucleoside-diphosphate-sugar epimerases [Sphingobacterium faecium PCAi_F2.5]